MTKYEMVCFASAFAYESAPNITHLVLEGRDRTVCGRRGWMTTEGQVPGGPDCLVCGKAWDRMEQADRLAQHVADAVAHQSTK